MTEPSPSPQYWFQIQSGAPLGPMTKEQFLKQHGSIPIAEIGYCEVGQSNWMPLTDHPDFREPLSTPSDSQASPLSSQAASPAKSSVAQPPEWIAVIVGVALLALAIYIVYEWVRPCTPKEVVERFDKCKTVEEAKALSTPHFHPALVTMYLLDDHASSGDEYEITDEGSGSSTEHFISFRGSFFDKTVGRRLPMAAFVTLRKSDGWKIDDFSIVSIDGQTFPEPVSLAKNHLLLLQDAQKNTPLVQNITASKPASQAADNKANQRLGILVLLKMITAGGAKTVGLGALAVGGLIYGYIRSRRAASV